MTDTKLYSGYVSYYIRNVGQNLSYSEWRKVLKDNLGSNISKTTAKKWKEFALKLYYIHFIGLSLKLNTDELIKSDKTPSELRNVLVASNDFRKEHDLDELSVLHYTSDAEAVKHMKKFQSSESTIDDVMNEAKSTKSTKSTKTTKKTVSKPKKTGSKLVKEKSTTASSTTAKKTKSTKVKGKEIVPKKAQKAENKKIPAFLMVKQGRKTITLTKKEDIMKHLHGEVNKKAKSATKNTGKSTGKSCGSYSVLELRKMAQEKEIKGRSKMTKAELCKALKIKE